jgi:hypothetical protein
MVFTGQSLNRDVIEISIREEFSSISIRPPHSFCQMVDIRRTVVTHRGKIIRFENVKHGHDSNST